MRLEVNKEDASRVLNDPRIFKTIAEDGMDYVPMPEGFVYLCGYVPSLIGCFVLHEQNCVTYECHVQVLPEHRDHSREFGKRVIKWAWENTDARKLVAQIPFLYPNVKDFALEMGFRVEGINRQSYLKDGSLVDQWHVGICL